MDGSGLGHERIFCKACPEELLRQITKTGRGFGTGFEQEIFTPPVYARPAFQIECRETEATPFNLLLNYLLFHQPKFFTMKAFPFKPVLLVVIVAACFSQNLMAQAGGNKPELFLWRYNGGQPSPAPALNGNVLGTVIFKATVPENKILTGADIQAVITEAPTASSLAARLSLRTGTPTLIERLTILSNGNVGINTINPLYRFHVEGDGFFSGNLSVGGDFNVAGSIFAGLDIVAGRDVKAGRHVEAVENVSGKNLMASQAITAGTTISAVGNITSAADVKGLNVSATELVSGKNLSASQTISAGTNIAAGGNMNAAGTITGGTVNSNGNMTAAGSVNAASVVASGNVSGANLNAASTITAGSRIVVGVAGGTPLGAHKLCVGGSITAEELNIELQADWPDYVFAEGHEIAPLCEVEAFIQKNRHLPGIPSAREMQQNGQKVGETQRLMMEKIEELFLHVISLEKEVSSLRTENQQLRNERD